VACRDRLSLYVVADVDPTAGSKEGSWNPGRHIAGRSGILRIVAIPRMEDTAMIVSATGLAGKRCQPCEGGVPPLSPEQIREHLAALPEWKLTADGQRIRREWRVKNFLTALDFFNRIGHIAEEENHHPDLHLTNYRQVAVELWTHAIGGLSENDFILASKIDKLPVELKR
jgi:4a-hydroxytetrahydrobiopterin dehydratase